MAQGIPDYLSKLDHEKFTGTEEDFKSQLLNEDMKFFNSLAKLKGAKKAFILAFQGRDAAGKTSASDHIVNIDSKLINYVHLFEPSHQELKHNYLWRIGKYDRLSAMGEGRVFDRSWNERVLVEKVMNLAPREEIENSYAEIRTFEWMLTRESYKVIKIWVEITPEEQLERYALRKADAPWKLTVNDEISRMNWDAYTNAANEMFYRLGTDFAPWYIVSGGDRQAKLLNIMKIVNLELVKLLSV